MRKLAWLAPIIAAILVAVLVFPPWEEATAGTTQYRACDFVIEAPTNPQKGNIRVTQLIEPGVESSLMIEVLGEPDASIVIDLTSDTVAIPATERVPDARLQPVLNTLHRKPLNPSTAPWPYTGMAQRPPIHQEDGIFRHRLPDPGSGLVVERTYVSMTDGSIVNVLGLMNCRSVMKRAVVFRRGEETEVRDLIDPEDVHPDDRAAFRTFFNELDIHEPAGPPQ